MHCQHVAFNSMTHKFAETNKPLDAQAPFFEPSLLLSTIIVRSMNMFTFSYKTCVFCFGFFGFMTDPLNGNLLHCFLPNFLSIQTRLFLWLEAFTNLLWAINMCLKMLQFLSFSAWCVQRQVINNVKPILLLQIYYVAWVTATTMGNNWRVKLLLVIGK